MSQNLDKLKDKIAEAYKGGGEKRIAKQHSLADLRSLQHFYLQFWKIQR